jgi:hypothetical protein
MPILTTVNAKFVNSNAIIVQITTLAFLVLATQLGTIAAQLLNVAVLQARSAICRSKLTA